MNLNINLKYKLAIFDLDGTIFDTLADIYDSLVAVFIKNGMVPPSFYEAQVFMGDGLRAFLQKAAAVNGAECGENVIEDFISYYAENCTKKTIYYPHVLEKLDTLRANGVKLALLSNKSEMLVMKILEDFNIRNYFISIAGGDTFAEKKPSPLPVRETLEKCGFQPYDAIIIGDSENDIASGNSAGIKTCLCKYGYGTTFKTEPDYSVDNAAELTNIIIKGNIR